MRENRSTARTLRNTAWENLNGNYTAMSTATFLNTIFFTLILAVVILSMILSPILGLIVLGIALILVFLFDGAFSLGYCNMCYEVASGDDVRVSGMFSGFKHFLKAFLANLLNGIFIILWTLIPAGLLTASVIFMISTSDTIIMCISIACTIVFGLLTLFTLLFKMLSYSMTYFVIAEDDSISANQARRISAKLMSGNKFRLFRLYFTFIGWHLLAILTLGLGYFWVTPYIYVTKAQMYDEISSENQDLFD